MKRKLAFSALVLFAGVSFGALVQNGQKPPGVAGELIVVANSNDDDADDDQGKPIKVEAKVGDKIAVHMPYPSGQMKKASAKSDESAVKFHEIRMINMVPPPRGIGVMHAGAFFSAEEPGTANLVFQADLETGGTKKVTCVVEVTK